MYFRLITIVVVTASIHIFASPFPCDPNDCSSTIFWTIPGPNPLITPGPDTWDKTEIENAGGVYRGDGKFGKLGKYYWLYHGLQHDFDYQVGLAEADHPLGPWIKYKGNPVLPKGSKKAWDGAFAASGGITSNGTHLLMFYEGAALGGSDCGATGKVPQTNDMCPGFAVSLSGKIEGPYQKYPDRIINSGASYDPDLKKKEFKTGEGFYVGNVMYEAGEYRAYMEAPIGTQDQGPMSLWTASSPFGKWKKKGYTLLNPTTGWDKGAYSESSVFKNDDTYFTFFSGSDGTDPQKHSRATGRQKFRQYACEQKRLKGLPIPQSCIDAPTSGELEHIGFAWSTDGISFNRHPSNPLASPSEMTPYMVAAAESHSFVDETKGLVYVYHTIRWNDGPYDWNNEDLGVTIFSPNWNFTVDNMRIVCSESGGVEIGAGKTTKCEYNPKTHSYCPAIRSVITSTGTDKVITADVALSLKGQCKGSQVDFTVNIFSSDNGKSKMKTPTVTLPVSYKCNNQAFTGQIPARQYAKVYQQFTVKNTGQNPVTNFELSLTLKGNQPQ